MVIAKSAAETGVPLSNSIAASLGFNDPIFFCLFARQKFGHLFCGHDLLKVAVGRNLVSLPSLENGDLDLGVEY